MKYAGQAGLPRCRKKGGQRPSCDSVHVRRVSQVQEWRSLLLASRAVGEVRRPSVRIHGGCRSPRSAKVRPLSPPAGRLRQVHAGPRASSPGPSKTAVSRTLRWSLNPPRNDATRRSFRRRRERPDILRAEKATAAFQGGMPIATRRCSRPPEDAAGPLRPMEIVRPLRPAAARLPTTGPLAEPSLFAPAKGSTMWPIFPQSSGHRHPSPGTSRRFAPKTSCRGAYTAVGVEFRFRSFTRAEIAIVDRVTSRSEALEHESLFRAFEILPGNCRRVRRQVQE